MTKGNGLASCLRPGCGRTAVCRGLCQQCYGKARGLVHEKRTTWKKLEAAGKVKARKVGGRYHGEVTQWLLGEKP